MLKFIYKQRCKKCVIDYDVIYISLLKELKLGNFISIIKVESDFYPNIFFLLYQDSCNDNAQLIMPENL